MKNFSIAVLLFALPGWSDAVSAHAQAGGSDNAPATRLSPQIRMHALPLMPEPSLSGPAPMSPVVADEAAIALAPRIVASREQRTYLAGGDRINVAGQVGNRTEFLVMRPASRLLDPVSGKALGRELRPLGMATLLRRKGDRGDGIHPAIIIEAKQEITTGDLLWPMPITSQRDKRPSDPAAGKLSDVAIISIADGMVHAAQNQIVGINKGTQDGVVEGASFALLASGRRDGAAGQSDQCGRMLILRVFDHVSYGLITQASVPVRVGDKVGVVEGSQ